MGVFTNTTRITGLSGIDTESMVTQIMRAESLRLHRLQRRSTLMSWTQQAYRSAATQINNFQRDFLGVIGQNSIRMGANMNSHRANLSSGANNTGSITATALPAARPGRHEVEVRQLANADRFEGTGQAFTGSIRGNIPASGELREGESFRLSLNGLTRDIEFSEEDITRINNGEFVDVLNGHLSTAFGANRGVRAEADGANGFRIVTATPSDRIVMTEAAGTPSSISSTLGDLSGLAGERHFYVNSGGQDVRVNVDFESGDLSQQEVINRINSALSQAGVAGVQVGADGDNLEFRAAGTNSDITLSGDLINSLEMTETTLRRTNALGAIGVTSGATNGLEGRTLSEIFEGTTFPMTFNINGADITLDESMTVAQMQQQINNSGAGVTLGHNSLTGRFTLQSNTVGEMDRINFGGNNSLADMLRLEHVEGTGQDAIFSVNGTDVRSASNIFTHEGVEFNFTNAGLGDTATVEVTTNTDRTRELIMNFVEEYNRLIDELNSLVTTNRPRTNTGGLFDPLIDEERREMSADEIRTWEEQGQTGLLHRSDALSRLTGNMRMILGGSVEVDGARINLSDMGITTSSDFRDRGRLVVDEARLDSALNNLSGEEIAGFFSNVGARLNEATNRADADIRRRAGADTGLASLENNFQTRIDNYQDRITRMETQLARMEQRLFAQFARMESAVMQSNSQMDFLFSMMGM